MRGNKPKFSVQFQCHFSAHGKTQTERFVTEVESDWSVSVSLCKQLLSVLRCNLVTTETNPCLNSITSPRRVCCRSFFGMLNSFTSGATSSGQEHCWVLGGYTGHRLNTHVCLLLTNTAAPTLSHLLPRIFLMKKHMQIGAGQHSSGSFLLTAAGG